VRDVETIKSFVQKSIYEGGAMGSQTIEKERGKERGRKEGKKEEWSSRASEPCMSHAIYHKDIRGLTETILGVILFTGCVWRHCR